MTDRCDPEAVSRGVAYVRQAAFDDGRAARLAGKERATCGAPRPFRGDWLRGYDGR